MNNRLITPERLLLGLWLVLLGGCAAPEPAPTDRFYRLPAADAPAPDRPLASGVLSLQMFEASGLLRERGIIHVAGTDSVELESYFYHLWHKVPTRLLRDHLADYLRSGGVAGTVTATPDASAELSLGGELREFMHVREPGNSHVVITLEMRLYGQETTAPLLLRDYSVREPVLEEGMEAVVAAFGRGLERLYGQFLVDAERAAIAGA